MPLYSTALRASFYDRRARPIPFAVVYFPTGTRRYSDRPFGRDGIGPFAPRILELAAFTFGTGTKPGGVTFPETSVVLEDTSGEIRDVVEGGVDVTGSRCVLGWGAQDVPVADWHTALDGRIGRPEYEGDAVRLTVRADEGPFRGTLPKAQILKAEAPFALDSSIGTYYPLLYGEHDALALTGRGMVPCPNYMKAGAGACRYVLCLGSAKAVTRVYLNGTLKTLTTDYTVSHPIVGGKLITSIDFVAETADADVVTADAIGYESVGDGSGEAILNPADQLRHMLANFGFGDWRLPPWNDPADYPLTLADFAAAAAHASLLGMEGGVRLGGSAQAEKVLDVVQRWLSSNLPFRAVWSEGGKFSVLPLSHIFTGYTSTGPAVPSSLEALFVRGMVHEIGDSFRPKAEHSVLRRVDLSYLYGAQDQKYFQSLVVQDVSQPEEVVDAFDLLWSAPHIV